MASLVLLLAGRTWLHPGLVLQLLPPPPLLMMSACAATSQTFPAGATCGDLNGADTGTPAYVCLTGFVRSAGSDTTAINGKTAAEAASKCCVEVRGRIVTC